MYPEPMALHTSVLNLTCTAHPTETRSTAHTHRSDYRNPTLPCFLTTSTHRGNKHIDPSSYHPHPLFRRDLPSFSELYVFGIERRR